MCEGWGAAAHPCPHLRLPPTTHQPRSEARPPQQTWPRSPADEDTMINADTRSEQYSAAQYSTVQYRAVHFNPTPSETLLLSE